MNRSIMQSQQDGLNQPHKENNLEQLVVSSSDTLYKIVASGEGWVMIQPIDGQITTLIIE
jgi:gluconate kinase